MIKTVRGDWQTCQSFVEDLKSRVGETSQEIEDAVREILLQVRTRGDQAVREYAEKFDGWCPERLELSREEMEEIAKDCDPAFLTSLKKAAENIRAFHQRQKQQPAAEFVDTVPQGVGVGAVLLLRDFAAGKDRQPQKDHRSPNQPPQQNDIPQEIVFHPVFLPRRNCPYTCFHCTPGAGRETRRQPGKSLL